MNDTLKRRLVGLLVLLILVFMLSWLLPNNWPESGEKGVPSTTLPLTSNGVDTTASSSATEPAVSDDTAAATPSTSSPATPATAAPSRAGALPESVDSVDSSAPPLSGAPSAPANLPVPKLAASLPSPTAKPAAPKPVEAAKPEVKEAPKPPALKLAQSLPPVTKPTAPAAVAPAPKPAATPAAKPATAPPVPAAPKLPAVLPTPPPPLVSTAPAQAKLWYVQIGSFADQGNAQTTLNLLQNIGYRGESKQITSASGSALYRVRLGPFPSEAVAQQAFDKVSHQGYPQARVVSEAGVAKR